MNTRPLSRAVPCSRALFTPLLALAASAALLATPTASAQVNYQFVTVGNPGNANDTVTASDGSGLFFGGVSYTYDIGEYDVTLSQYCTFLNAVAKTDTYALYNTSLGTNANIEGISRSGGSGSYSYAVIGDGNLPVTYVSWFDAARMANWMQNGQPTGLGEVAGSTETGAYTLNGANSGVSISKNANAVDWIPTESEWYKAAYYDPTLNSGAGGYWKYATRSNTAPGNNATNPTLANQANYNNGVYSVNQSSTKPTGTILTDVGEFSNSPSYYGTYDLNGDVYTWNDSVIGTNRGLRGGSWGSTASNLPSDNRNSKGAPQLGGDDIGIRLATVPEPSVAVSLIVAGGLLLVRRKRPSAL